MGSGWPSRGANCGPPSLGTAPWIAMQVPVTVTVVSFDSAVRSFQKKKKFP